MVPSLAYLVCFLPPFSCPNKGSVRTRVKSRKPAPPDRETLQFKAHSRVICGKLMTNGKPTHAEGTVDHGTPAEAA